MSTTTPRLRSASQLPHSPEAEKIVLGTLFFNPKCINKVTDVITKNDFYDERNKKLFDLLVTAIDKDRPITEAMIAEESARLGYDLDTLYIFDMTVTFVGEDSLLQHVFVIKEFALKRQMIANTMGILKVLQDDHDYSYTLEQIEKFVTGMNIRKNTSKDLSVILKDALTNLQRRWSGEDVIHSGFKELDELTGGFYPGQLIIIGARPGMGKTSLGVSIAYSMIEQKKRVSFISLEMTSADIALKTLSIESGIAFTDLRDGTFRKMNNGGLNLIQAAHRMSDWPLEIEDALGSIKEIKSYAREAKRERNIDVLIIDYLGLIEASRSRDRKDIEIADITRALKMLAKELNVPIILLCQLNRESERQGENRPKLSQLRDSGAIEQDADIILLLFRAHYYDKNHSSNHAELILAKQRLGATKTIELYYDPYRMHFRDV